VLDESSSNQPISATQPRLAAPLDAFARWFNNHWLALVVGILLVYSLLPFVAPVLMKAGLTSAAQVIYQPYKLMCHTYAFRSFFLFGEQLVYPRGNGDGAFEQATGIRMDPAGLVQARDFQGNERVGYKVALCERDIAIYLAIAISGMAFALVRRRARPLPWLWFLLIGILPIAIDGFSQLFSQPPLNFLPFRESTWYWRVITGSLFGFSVAWLIFPIIEASMGSVKQKA
jgi:uncharacterized membrane protein